MALSVDHSYETACILATIYSNAHTNDSLKSEHFSTDEKVTEFCAEVFVDIFTNQEILTLPVSLGVDQDVLPTNIEAQIRNLSSSLERKGVSDIYRQVFQREVVDKLDVICAVDPRVYPVPKIFSNHLKSLRTMVADDQLKSHWLNTDDAVHLFTDSFLRMLDNNKQYLSCDKVSRLVGEIGKNFQSPIFDTVVLQRLPELVHEGKRLKSKANLRMKLQIMKELSLHKDKHADLNKRITGYLTKPSAAFNPVFIKALSEAGRYAQKPSDEIILNLSEEELTFVLELRDISWHINTLQIGLETVE